MAKKENIKVIHPHEEIMKYKFCKPEAQNYKRQSYYSYIQAA